MRFSERIGLKKISDALQYDSMSEGLKNRIINLLHEAYIKNYGVGFYSVDDSFEYQLYCSIMLDFFKQSYSEILSAGFEHEQYFKDILQCTLSQEWYELFDLLEFLINDVGIINDEEKKKLNIILDQENSAYRLSKENRFIPIIDSTLMKTIDNTLDIDSFYHAKQHVSKAILSLSDKKNSDYNSVVRESINAVESCLITLAGLDSSKKNTLGIAIKVIKQKYGDSIDFSFLKPFEQLYGFASNNGIRHSANEGSVIVDLADAILVLTTCSALLNYLSSKQLK